MVNDQMNTAQIWRTVKGKQKSRKCLSLVCDVKVNCLFLKVRCEILLGGGTEVEDIRTKSESKWRTPNSPI